VDPLTPAVVGAPAEPALLPPEPEPWPALPPLVPWLGVELLFEQPLATAAGTSTASKQRGTPQARRIFSAAMVLR
jgi:hypothetical protein